MEVQEINFPDRLQHIFKEIRQFCQSSMRNAVDIDLILETKGLEKEQIEELLDLGVGKLRVNEENFVKMRNLNRGKIYFNGNLDGFDWKLFKNTDVWENLQNLEQAEKVNEFLIKNQIILKTFLKIDLNEGGEGFGSKQIFLQMKELGKFKNLKIQGIILDEKQISEEDFHKMKAIFDLLKQKYKGIELLVMGNVRNLREAIKFGSHRVVLNIKDLK